MRFVRRRLVGGIVRVLKRFQDDESGFTLLEPVIAMLLLMIVAVAVLPILTNSLVQSSRNAEVVSATALGNRAIEDERAQTSCGALTALDQTSTSGSTRALRVVRQLGSCPSSYPGTVRVTVLVTDAGTGTVETSATTLVFVTGA